MLNTKEVKGEKDQLGSLQTLMQTYEEIAAIRMRKTRSGILMSRDFVGELTKIYQTLKATYKQQIIQILKENDMYNSSLLLLKREKKSVAVFISSNAGLYGDILQKTYRQFGDFVNQHDCDVVIAGSFGQRLFEEEYPNKHFTSFSVSDEKIQNQDVEELIKYLLQYENVYIFYGMFESVGKQTPTMLDVYGEELTAAEDSEVQVKYLFEPSLEKILLFFEQEIFATIAEQAFHESELAKYTSRMITLDNAMENIKQRMKKIDLASRLLTHRTLNKKQLEGVSSMALWRLR